MGTIVIETADRSSRRYDIDLANESKEFVAEFNKFVAKLEAKGKTGKKNGSKRLNSKLKRASAYIDSILSRPESKAALAEADEIRGRWLRKNG